MRFLRLGLRKRRVQHDPARQQQLLQDVRQQFGTHLTTPYGDQSAQLTQLLVGTDGLLVATEILREFAESAHASVVVQAAGLGLVADRTNYRTLWKTAGKRLRSPLFEQPLHPYIQVTAAVKAVGAQARETVRVTDPEPLLSHVFEVLDLTVAGWQYGRVLVDTHGAELAAGLITTATELRNAMDDPPPLPPPVREQMRSNASVDVLDPAASLFVGQWNPGKQMRESLLA
ncbi:hypothetical protein AMIS_59030 [Actinoplanes missouriensis 431]|uniref:Uncharacterized protein n=1 Tax=Actinoplanes missouriensis (strain ATCC 14538 / DSM 43046 / CBS 188.64 / JCM 3121 / NBRC 102363 / NCIMB 12654 / NRRL B-3342 / UNCC 431) TaxID=512565 RepID=I0HDN6_ACTM4|nr:hypothetical protein [Actinoplanes missouriensis]BAL91123.1 hypothetical protein AMIS_59030 [Actinoplanes missouriensis 431]